VLGRLHQLGLAVCFTDPDEPESTATDSTSQQEAMETTNPDMMFAKYALTWVLLRVYQSICY